MPEIHILRMVSPKTGYLFAFRWAPQLIISEREDKPGFAEYTLRTLNVKREPFEFSLNSSYKVSQMPVLDLILEDIADRLFDLMDRIQDALDEGTAKPEEDYFISELMGTMAMRDCADPVNPAQTDWAEWSKSRTLRAEEKASRMMPFTPGPWPPLA